MSSDETDTRSRSPASKYNDSRLRNRVMHVVAMSLTEIGLAMCVRCHIDKAVSFLAGRFGFSILCS